MTAIVLSMLGCSSAPPSAPADATTAEPSSPSPAPLSRAEQVEKAPCEAGDLEACFRLAAAYRYGYGETPVAPGKAGPLLEAGCEKQHAASCNDLGAMYAEGTAVVKDEARAAALYARACEGGMGMGCTNLAAFTLDGTAVPANPKEADTLYTKACGLGEQDACRDLAMALVDGRMPKDEARAHGLLRTGCDAKHGQSCADLGYLYLNGIGVAADPEMGAELMRHGCRLGYQYACGFGP